MNLTGRANRRPRWIRGVLYFLIGYHVVALAALLITGGFEFEIFGASVSSNRISSPLTGLCISMFLLFCYQIGWPNSLLVAISTSITLGFCEWGLRVFEPPIAQPALMQVHQPSNQLGYELKPSSEGYGNLGEYIQINSFGARDHEFGPKKSDIPRIVVIGDSFTFGFGVPLEDTYVKQLEVLLTEKLGPVEVLNLGVTAYQAWHFIELLEERVASLEPDLAIVAFFLDDMAYPVRPNIINARNPAEVWNENKESKFRLGALTRTVSKQLDYLIRHQRGREYLRSIEERRDFIQADVPVMYALQTGEIDGTLNDQIDAAIQTMARWSSSRRTPLLGLYIPDASQVNQPELQFINKRLAELFRRFDMVFVDSTPAFDAHPDVRELFLFPLDAHTNVLGHKLIAEQLANNAELRRLLSTP
jgi:lysophospholipase L1-like esterase